MREYGNNKATEFTKKQISVIYGAAKRNELKVEKWIISEFYDLADYYGFDDNRSVERAEAEILQILSAVFNKDMTEAQRLIDLYTESTFNALGSKRKSTVNRNLVA